MKKILGIDLGTTSIGFAQVNESDDFKSSSIVRIGVRVNPLTTDEQTNFEKGKPISINAERTLKRGARRTLDRYQDRRSNLIHAMSIANLITNDTVLAENGKNSTHTTIGLRAKSAIEKVQKGEFARILLAINKKRGYKSSRKANSEDEGKAVDGMEIAKKLYEDNVTPGQLAYQLIKDGKKNLPDFYRSDLQAEFDRVWIFQQQFYPEILTDEFKSELAGKGQRATSAIFWKTYNFNTAENKGTREEKKLKAYQWRSNAVQQQLQKEEVAYVITEINNNLNNSSGYLGSISDRSKELYFNKQTVGQYLFQQIQDNPHTKLKSQVFYRQDYFDEFEVIWETQSKFHPELTAELKNEIRDIIIFYQRKLKSQKSLISFCEFERKEITIERFGQKVQKTIGLKVSPKSSPLFQEFKIWQVLSNVLIRKKDRKKTNLKVDNQISLSEEQETFAFDLEAKQVLFEELNIKGNLKASKVLELLGYTSKEWEMNYSELEGNRTNKALFDAFLKIIELEGYDTKELMSIKSNKDEVELDEINVPAMSIKDMVKGIFESLAINTAILEFNAELNGKDFEQQSSYQLWHLLQSYEGDDSPTGNERLYELLSQKFGFRKEHAQILAAVTLSDEYGNLSAKAMRRIYPYIREQPFDKAAANAGYRHSASSLTREEISNRPLKEKLDLVKKNSLRNPVVEKILNQLVNVVNTLIETNSEKDTNGKITKLFRFDEIRIELSRDLKKNAKERGEMTSNINSTKIQHERIFKLLQAEFGVKNPTRNDIIRYKLYEELKNNGYKDLYTNTYIPREILFSKEVDIEHIIPQSKVFDDSYSNKTIVFRKDNLDKGNQTAFDYINSRLGKEKLADFEQRIEFLFEQGKKNKDEGISKAKYLKLLKQEEDIGEGFIERDLKDTQYIAKKARNMLYEICRVVTPTTGSITDRLRKDWDLINVMQELNFNKFKQVGLTEMVEKKDGSFKERIVDWNKRNDHRHHAMDALTIAFTKHNHIQYLNYLNARKNEDHKQHKNIIAIEAKETTIVIDDLGNKKRKFNLPLPNFREESKKHLENILVSFKAKNKVVTKNKNKTISAKGEKIKIELTPRGQLHKETVYGRYQFYLSKDEKIGLKFDLQTIAKVANPTYKRLLFERLVENENDAKIAFAGKNALPKNPIYLDDKKMEPMPETVKLIWLESDYSIRKNITPENFKDIKIIDKILDEGVKRILKNRLADYNNNPKEAFSNLEKNPIWLNEEKGIAIKRVKISGVNNAEPLHYKKNHFGNEILDEDNKPIPTDFVSTGNNHHVAIYRDEKDNLQEYVVSFYEAVARVNQGLPIIDKTLKGYLGWKFLFTMKQNEYFIFPNEQTGFYPSEIDLLDAKNNKLISPNLFRVQKIAIRDYFFRHHLETNVEDNVKLKNITWKREGLSGISNIVKVRINHTGQILKVGEY
jgi:CRISPR-associated endonuclease Csn1